MFARGQSLVRHFFEWASSVMRAGWGLAAYIFGGFLVTVHDRISGVTPFSLETLVAPLGIALPIAFFQSWRIQRIRFEKATSELNDKRETVRAQALEIQEKGSALVSIRQELDQERQRNTPNLMIDINRLLYSPDLPDGVDLKLTVTVRNPPPGADSSADHWGIWITPVNGSRVYYRPRRIGGAEKVSGSLPNGKQWEEVVSETDAIYNKAKTPPIARGDSRTGYLFVLAAGGTQQALQGATLEVQCLDINLKPVLTQNKWVLDFQNPSKEITYFAGLTSSYTESASSPNVGTS